MPLFKKTNNKFQELEYFLLSLFLNIFFTSYLIALSVNTEAKRENHAYNARGLETLFNQLVLT